MATDTSKKKKATAKIHGVAVPLRWNVPDNIITRYASNIVVQRLENEFKILFFEICPDIKLAIEQRIPEEVQANCVASIVVSAGKLDAFIKVLQTQSDAHKEIKSNLILPSVSKAS